MDDMAIFKANFIPKTVNVRSVAKAHIRYIEHRSGKDKEKITRTLYNSDGAMGRWEAYRMIDEAEKGSVFYRLVINFDAQKEDTHKDIYVQEVTEKTMLGLEDRLAQHIQWVAATHDDHTPLRHVHILAILPKRLQVYDLQTARNFATEAALEQRRERDKGLEQKREREEVQWER
jgi:hypothetical protein